MLQQPAGLGTVTGFGGRQQLDERGVAVDQWAQVALEQFDLKTELRSQGTDELAPADPVKQARRVQDRQIPDGWAPLPAGNPGGTGLREYRGMTGSVVADSCPNPGNESA
jgi:hypothetical protein